MLKLDLERPNLHDRNDRLCVKSLTLQELQRWFAVQGERPSRADQLWRWVYGRRSELGPGATTSGRPAEVSTSSPASTSAAAPSSVGLPSVQPQGGVGSVLYGGGLRRLEDVRDTAVDGFSAAFLERFGPLLSLDGGLSLVDVSTARDGTRKMVFAVTEGEAAGGRIETVLIPWFRDYDPRVSRQERPRYTLCVSSQVGCAMNCQFCFTGRRGLLGNLSTAQIMEQVLVAQKLLELEAAEAAAAAVAPNPPSPSSGGAAAYAASAVPPITNLVFMGMGEPLHNAPAVFAAIDILTHRRALSMSASRITLSTVGLLPQLQHFLDRYAPPPPPPPLPHRQHQPDLQPGAPLPPTLNSGTGSSEGTVRSSEGESASSSSSDDCKRMSSSSGSRNRSVGGVGGNRGGGGGGDVGSGVGSAGGGGTVPRVSLAVSIHAGTDSLRNVIVPSNTRLTLPPPPPQQQQQQQTSRQLQYKELRHNEQHDNAGKPEGADRGAAAGAHSGGLPAARDVRAASSAATSEGGPSGSSSRSSHSGGSGGEEDKAEGPLLGLAALCEVLARHYPRTDRRPLRAGRYVLFEYTMLGGVNDWPEDAEALLEATRYIECSFNLIMFNPFPGTVYTPSTDDRVEEFQRVLRERGGRIVHVRRSKGDTGMAACGQLGDVGPLGDQSQGHDNKQYRQKEEQQQRGSEGPGAGMGSESGGDARRKLRGGARMLPEAVALAEAAAAASSQPRRPL